MLLYRDENAQRHSWHLLGSSSYEEGESFDHLLTKGESHLIILRGNTNLLSHGAGAGASQPSGLRGSDPVLTSNPTTASPKLGAVWQ